MAQRLTAMDIVKMFEEDSRARKRLAEILVSDESVRLAMINAVLRDVATKQDLEKLRSEFKQDIEKLENRLRTEFRQEIEKLRNEFKQDLDRVRNELRTEFRQEISRLENRIDRVEERVGNIEQRLARLEGRMDLLIKVFIGFNVPILIAVIGILLKMLFKP